MINVLSVTAEFDLKRVAGRARTGDGIYWRAISKQQAYWVAILVDPLSISGRFGFLWPELNRFAYKALAQSAPAEYPFRIRNMGRAGPPFYMCDIGRVSERFADENDMRGALQTFLSGDYIIDTLDEAFDEAVCRARFVPSGIVLVPAALALLRRFDELREYTERYLSTLPPGVGHDFYGAYYAYLSDRRV